MSRHRTIIRLSAVLAVVALAKGCGDGESPTTPPTPEPARPTTVTVSPATAELTALGETVQLTAEVRDQNARVMAGATVTWTSSANSVATVDASGLVVGVAEGTATIRASAGSAQGTAEITVAPDLDRLALVALYEATDGPNWVNNDNWLTDAPLGDWYGVDVDASGRVVRLALGGVFDRETYRYMLHGLKGPIPPELGNLTELRHLDLGANELTGPIPPELENLANLQLLRLHNNVLTGPIPPGLGNLSELRELGLQESGLSGPIPAEIGKLINLQRLGLRKLPKAGPIPPELGNLVNLQYLHLAAGSISGRIPPELGNLNNLIDLELYGNGLVGPIPPELGSLANLRQLQLRRNQLSGPVPPELGNLARLEWFSVDVNRLAGTVPPELGNLVNLRTIDLSRNPQLVGPLPTSLTDLDSLIRLAFQETGLCAPQTTEFQLWLQGIERVEGKNCSIIQESDREALAAIYRWTNGDGWRSNNNWLGDGPLDDWYGVTADGMDRVTALDLSDNNLEGFVPAETGDLLYIEKLVLNGNSALGEELSPRMLQLVFLSTLRLDGTGVCTSAAPEFLDWLDRIADARVAACPDDHGNDATGATSIAVGQRAEGEIESYLDEDWFRVEVGGRGTLTATAESNIEVNGELYDGEGTRVGYDGWFQDFSISRHVTPGTYYVRVTGGTEEARGSYNWVSSFEPRTLGVRTYLTQAVQSHDFAVPLVAGEDALLRVFVMTGSGVTASMPPVRARFYQGEREVHSVWIDGSSQPVPQTMAEGDLDATANTVVPGSTLVPGTEMVLDVDPDGTLDP